MERLGSLVLWSVLSLFAFTPQQSQVGQRNFTPPASGGCSLPYSDSFASTGSLNACWTTPAAPAGVSGTVTSGGGQAVATSGAVAVLAATAPANQSAQVSIVTVGSYNGPVVRMTASSGNGYAWLVNIQSIYVLIGGGFSAIAISGTCPIVSNGDVVKLSITGTGGSTSLTCLDVTTSASTTGADGSGTNYSSGQPGLLVYPSVSVTNFVGTSP
jgi:hypothetical protein